MSTNKWLCENPEISYGIVVGLNWGMEIMLHWWWEHYSFHNRFPVTFFDLGMTPSAVRYCQERGEVVKVKVPYEDLKKRMKVPLHWEKKTYGEGIYYLQQYRRFSWFKKPFCLLHSPYRYTLWLDIDCQVRGDLFDAFFYSENDQGISLASTDGINASLHRIAGWDAPSSHFVNSGVVAFKHGSSVIEAWAKAVRTWEEMFYGDQDVLAEVLSRGKKKLQELPRVYNWRVNKWGENSSVLIAHYAGEARKSLFKI